MQRIPLNSSNKPALRPNGLLLSFSVGWLGHDLLFIALWVLVLFACRFYYELSYVGLSFRLGSRTGIHSISESYATQKLQWIGIRLLLLFLLFDSYLERVSL